MNMVSIQNIHTISEENWEKKERKKKPLAKRKVQRHPPHPSYPQNTIFE